MDLQLAKKTTAGISLGVRVDNRKYKLDSAAIGFSLLSNKRVTNVFRIECHLKEKVDAKKLHEALSNILPRFPYFRVSIRRGLFWGKWVTNLTIPEIQSERPHPCQYISFGRKKLLYRVIVNENRIIFECQHCLTDGYGGTIFINSLVTEYFRVIGIKSKECEGIFTPREEPNPLEYEDSYERYYKKMKRRKGLNFKKRSFNIPNKLEPPGIFHLSRLVLSLENIKNKSKELGVSITALLTAMYFESLKDLQEELYKDKPRKIKPIRMRVPVNLRQMFPSKTMRNFSLGVRLDFDDSMDSKSLKERAKEIDVLLKNEIQPDTFYRKFAFNIGNTNMPIMQITPYQVKRFFARTGYYYVSAPYYSGVISNLGRIKLPNEIMKYIDSYDMVIGPSAMHKERVAVVSFKDRFIITFSRSIKESILTELFERKLRKIGLKLIE